MASLNSSRTVGIIGLGAIGGSLLRALASRGVGARGWARDRPDVLAARAVGLDAHEWASPSDAAPDADLVVLAVPLDELASVARRVRDANPNATLIHTSGLQRLEALELDAELSAVLYGAHPLAGSDRSGFDASSDSMFENRVVLAESRAPAAVRARIESLWAAVGARVEYVDGAEHDRIVAWMSHLPQLTSVALAATLEATRIPGSRLGTGGRDATRLAASSLLAWRPILDRAPPDTIAALRALESSVAALRQAMEEGDQEIVAEQWSRGRRWRLGIDGEGDARRR